MLWASVCLGSGADEWIVTAKSPKSFQGLRARVLKRFGPNRKFALIKGPIKTLRQRFKTVQPNFVYSFVGDPEREKSWGLQNLGQTPPGGESGVPGKDAGVVEAWSIEKGSREVVVAVLDSGMFLNHEELKNNLWTSSERSNGLDDDHNGYIDDINGWNFISNNADVSDDNDHGSFVAGIIGAEGENNVGSHGVASKIRIMPLKILDALGFGNTASAIEAITYAVENGAHFINASWGGEKYDPALENAIQWAGEKGVLFIAAAGNNGASNDVSGGRVYPAAFNLENLISVAAYDNQDRLWKRSNWGKRSVHLGGPGVHIYSSLADGGYGYDSGTSYAAPFVTGVAALLKSHFPTWNWKEIKDRILSTAEVIDYYQKDRLKTAGRVHAYRALKGMVSIVPESPDEWAGYSTWVSSPHPYSEGYKKSYTFQHPGATHLRVHFKKFETEKCCDKVRLYDREGKLVYEYSGIREPFWSAEALGDTLVVEIASDFVTNHYGFDIDAFEVSFDRLFFGTTKFPLPFIGTIKGNGLQSLNDVWRLDAYSYSSFLQPELFVVESIPKWLLPLRSTGHKTKLLPQGLN